MENNNTKKTNTFALLGLIFTFFLQPLGLIFSIVGLSQIKKTNEDGRGLAIAGIVISIIQVVMVILITFVFSALIWPEMKNEITNATYCSQAISCRDLGNGYSECEYYLDASETTTGTVRCENAD